MKFLDLAYSLLQQFAEVTTSHVPQNDNEVANELSQQASGCWLGINEINNLETIETQVDGNKDWRLELK